MIARPQNPLADHYDDLYRGSGFGDAPAFYEWILRIAQPPKEGRVLDLGCGRGGAMVALGQAGLRGVGLDFSSVALEGSRERTPSLPHVRGDGTRLPFVDHSFDTILNLGNLEHFDDWVAGMAEMRRVLSPEGRAWILLPNLFYSGVIWRICRGGEGANHHQPIDRFATREEWRAWLDWGGLNVVRVIPYHKGKGWKRLLPSAWAWHFLYECRRGEPSSAPPPPAPLERRVATLGDRAEHKSLSD